MNTAERKSYLEQEFARRLDGSPTYWVRAPGRVDLMGSHTDYNAGFVLTMPIDRDTWIAARPRTDGKVVIQSLDIPGVSEFDLRQIAFDHKVHWANYVRGVAVMLQRSGYPLVGFDGLIHSTIPLGAGLSSSAALEVATGMLFQRLGNLVIAPVLLAQLCQQAENHFVGVNCGILDQYTAVLGAAGSAVLLDCRQLNHQQVDVPDNLTVVICDTCTKRTLAGTEYAERRVQCEEGVRRLQAILPRVIALRDVSATDLKAHMDVLPELVARRCKFIVEENARVLALGRALSVGDRDTIAALTAASFAGARELYEIVSPAMEWMMAAIHAAPGIIGARQAGAGFGGCMVAFVDSTAVKAFCAYVSHTYRSLSGIDPSIYPVRPVAGAEAICVDATL